MSPTDRVQAQFDAYNRRDLPAFLACYAPDAVVDDGSRQVIGRDALGEAYARLFALPDLRAELAGRLALGNWVVDHEVVHGIRDTPVQAIAVYTVEDDLITSVRLMVA